MNDDSAHAWHLIDPMENDDPHEAVKRWEKLRLLYNALLIPWAVLNVVLWHPGRVDDLRIWEEVVVGGLIANVCFCLGPVLETYLVWMGANPRAARNWLFVLGTMFTALGAMFAIMVT